MAAGIECRRAVKRKTFWKTWRPLRFPFPDNLACVLNSVSGLEEFREGT